MPQEPPPDVAIAWAIGALAVAALLIIAGAGKLRHPGSMRASFASLHVPERLVPPWLPRLAPWAEIAAGTALAIAPAPWAAASACACAALSLLYLTLIARAARLPVPAACDCFGAQPRPVTGWTVVRGCALALLACGLAASAIALLPAGPPAPLAQLAASPALTALIALLSLLGLAMVRGGELSGAAGPQPAAQDIGAAAADDGHGRPARG